MSQSGSVGAEPDSTGEERLQPISNYILFLKGGKRNRIMLTWNDLTGKTNDMIVPHPRTTCTRTVLF